MISYNIPASLTQIIEQLTCERARYHVSADKMQCGQRMFSLKGATLKVHRSRLPKAVGVERSHYPLTSHTLSCDKNATLRRRLQASARIEEREFWAGRSVCPRWDSRPSRIFSPHTTWPLTSTTLQCSCWLAKPVLNCARRPLQPAQPHAVPCGS